MDQPRSFQPFTSPTKTRKAQNDGEVRENMWSGLLDSVGGGKRLPEKTVLLLGGSVETQKEFLETLSSDSTRKHQERHRKKPPIANEFAFGYTYQDVLDADQEDTLARLSIYTLPEALPAYVPLLIPLLTAKTVPNTLFVILLDWSEPWKWVRQIRDWIQLLREVLTLLDDDAKDSMEELMHEWQQGRKGGAAAYDSGGGGTISKETNTAIPLGPGEWDEALGIPLSVVCYNSNVMDSLENDHGWREEEFDFVLQFLRTILLKRMFFEVRYELSWLNYGVDGASLIYSSSSNPNHLPTLIHSTLGIQSLLKRQILKHNVIDRDKILIPPNWDSWGKIRVLREGFDVEAVSIGWSKDIQLFQLPLEQRHDKDQLNFTSSEQRQQKSIAESGENSLVVYKNTISNPRKENALEQSNLSRDILEVETMSMQEFLAGQLEVMEHLKAQEEHVANRKDDKNTSSSGSRAKVGGGTGPVDDRSRVNDHIGPVQFNVGGIQVDAEDMLKRLNEREETPDREMPASATPDGKSQNEALASFFAGLIKRNGSSSPRPNPS
ncbi:hypothetical protein MMC18_006263 [Xylographa bjoerkii]|nr:hypothetical protein [Xylographa bjoerkii]